MADSTARLTITQTPVVFKVPAEKVSGRQTPYAANLKEKVLVVPTSAPVHTLIGVHPLNLANKGSRRVPT